MPSFFEEVDASGVVENHIKTVLKLEDDQAQQILDEYKDVRQELVDRLSSLPRGSFTAQHVRGVLAQVQGAIGALNNRLQTGIVSGAYQAAFQGISDLTKEINVFDKKFTGAVTPINLHAALLAHDTSQFLVTRYKTNLDAYSSEIYRQVSNGIFSATIGEITTDEIVGRVSNFFNGEEWKLHRLVRTELHGVYNRGKFAGMEQLANDGVIDDLKKTLIHPMDNRTGEDSKLAARLALVAEMDQPFVYNWKGVERVFMVPPDRPNDRSVMVPYRDAWGSDKGPAFLPF